MIARESDNKGGNEIVDRFGRVVHIMPPSFTLQQSEHVAVLLERAENGGYEKGYDAGKSDILASIKGWLSATWG